MAFGLLVLGLSALAIVTSGSSFVARISSTPHQSRQRSKIAGRHVEPMPLVTPFLRRSSRILIRQSLAAPPEVELLRLNLEANSKVFSMN